MCPPCRRRPGTGRPSLDSERRPRWTRASSAHTPWRGLGNPDPRRHPMLTLSSDWLPRTSSPSPSPEAISPRWNTTFWIANTEDQRPQQRAAEATGRWGRPGQPRPAHAGACGFHGVAHRLSRSTPAAPMGADDRSASLRGPSRALHAPGLGRHVRTEARRCRRGRDRRQGIPSTRGPSARNCRCSKIPACLRSAAPARQRSRDNADEKARCHGRSRYKKPGRNEEDGRDNAARGSSRSGACQPPRQGAEARDRKGRQVSTNRRSSRYLPDEGYCGGTVPINTGSEGPPRAARTFPAVVHRAARRSRAVDAPQHHRRRSRV